jgi:hypothetical protein
VKKKDPRKASKGTGLHQSLLCPILGSFQGYQIQAMQGDDTRLIAEYCYNRDLQSGTPRDIAPVIKPSGGFLEESGSFHQDLGIST